MGTLPIRSILSFATLVGVVTAGAVLILGAPRTQSDRLREASEEALRTRQTINRVREAMVDGRLRDAQRLTDRFTETSPDDPRAWLYYSLVRQRQGEHDDARDGWGRLLSLTRQPDGQFGMNANQMFMHGWAHYGAGRERDAFRIWWQTANSVQGRGIGGDRFYELAQTLAASGRHEDAVVALHLAIDSGFRQLVVLNADPALVPLRGLPSFEEAVDRLVRRSMGRHPIHGPNIDQGETYQILSREPPMDEQIRAWIRRWGDL